MGLTRTELFTESQNEMASLAKALAHPARVAIIEHLLKIDACINSHLVEELGLAQATVSQHLRELKSIGIVQGTIEGVSVSYCIDPKRWHEIEKLFAGLFSRYSSTGKNCC
jgi:DNA-binding transcriptional ArsR family regulator